MIIDMLRFLQTDLHILYLKRDGNGAYKYTQTPGNFHIYIFLSGYTEIYYKDAIYIAKPNDVLILNNSEKCILEHSGKPNEILFISFNPTTFRNIDKNTNILKPFEYSSRMKILNDSLTDTDFIEVRKNLINNLITHKSRVFIFSDILRLLCCVYDIYVEHQGGTSTDEANGFTRIISYIDDHITENFTLQDIADNVFLSKVTIQKLIKNVSNKTFRQLVLDKRFAKINQYLHNTDLPLEEIAKDCGYNSYTSFYRDYKKIYGVPPIQARKNTYRKK